MNIQIHIISRAIQNDLESMSVKVVLDDRGNRVSVYIDDKKGHRLLNIENLVTRRIQKPQGMQSLITHIRANLEERGYM